MRRKDKEITDNNIIEDILKEAPVCRIGLIDGKYPYVIPMNFVYHDNSIYIHSANEGKKIDLIKKNNSVCFEVDIKGELKTNEKPCNFGYKYFSITGNGKAFFIEEINEKKQALITLMKKHTNSEEWEIAEDELKKTAVIKINIKTIAGKKSGYE
jgi:nitroimidazol reductase NimA-like FMN-containing flavoprotein (pyridoxamine 5'-phosphate oxidase superfamily)